MIVSQQTTSGVEACAFDLGQLGFTDWKPVQNARLINAADFEAGTTAEPIRAAGDCTIEWRLAPSQHIGAASPQLLYRNTAPLLCNSFMTAMPARAASIVHNGDVVARVFTPQACHPKMLHVYQGWVIARLDSGTDLNCYMAAVYRNGENSSDVVSIWRVTGGTRTTKLAASAIGNRIDWSKPWHCRFNFDGQTLKAKWWSYDVIEPVAWDLGGEDDAFLAPGLIGYASTVHGGIAENIWGLDWFSWSNDAAVSAPLYPYEPVI